MSQPVAITLALRPPSLHSLSWPSSSTTHTPKLERRRLLQDPATRSFSSVHASKTQINPSESNRNATTTAHLPKSPHQVKDARMLSCNNTSGTTATSLVTASTRIRRKRRGTQSSLLGYLTRSAGVRGSSSVPPRHRNKSTAAGGETRPSYLQTLSATSATIARALARSPFASSPSLPPRSSPNNHTCSSSSSSSSCSSSSSSFPPSCTASSSSSPCSPSAHPTPPSCQICHSILSQEHPISQSGSSPRSYWQEHRYYQG